MLKPITNWLKRRIHGRPFEALQIEVTSRCCSLCVMCPRSTLAHQWPEIDLPWEAFQRIGRAFECVQHVHLQGWGEPLLHPRLFDMIAVAKAAGCRVGLTTNGMNLNREAAKRFLDLQLDLLSVSIAGASRETHQHLRISTDFSLILENVRQYLAKRAERPGGGTKVELSYLMTKSNILELPKAIELAGSLGVDELYAINLDYVVTPAHDEMRVFGCPELRDQFARPVDEARERARHIGLAFRAYPLDLEEVAVCEAQPTKILVVSCEGWVAPCTYLAVPGQTEILRWFQGKRVRVPAVRFGNIMQEDLLAIWERPAYREFRQRFAERRMRFATQALATLAGGGSAEIALPPPPEPCRTCYKLYGI